MNIPFEYSRLQSLMGDEGIDLAVASTRHNVRYLLGGYYYHFHENSTRMARSQYLPFVGVTAADPEASFYIHRQEEAGQMGTTELWIPNRADALRGTLSSAAALVGRVKALGLERARIGLEMPFLPADAFLALRRELPDADFVDVTAVFEKARARKSPAELAIMRQAYANLAEAIHEAFLASSPGDTTKDIARRVEMEIAERGLSYLFALVCAGPGFLRAPSQARWEKGQILHIDAGGADRDYIADICRMGCIGEPSPLARELHRACIQVQDEVRARVRPGLSCRDLVEAGDKASRAFPFSQYARFVVHGIGMVPYEEPLFSPENDGILEEGMVLSIETDFIHPEVGHVKIEDAVAVTANGCEGLGDAGRDWTIIE
ncbi:MAG: Xaa-Pro peptidase family protein [Rectinemataceae bacterium]|nr:Xaa-Pro peptidase family protein [Rectinemataceae bacterium]